LLAKIPNNSCLGFSDIPEQKEARSSSQHDDAVGCPFSLYCNFEINLRLYAISLVVMKNIMSIKTRNSKFGLPFYLRK